MQEDVDGCGHTPAAAQLGGGYFLSVVERQPFQAIPSVTPLLRQHNFGLKMLMAALCVIFLMGNSFEK